MTLSPRDRDILRAAAGPHRNAGAELDALTWASGMSLPRTWQRLNELMSEREAWEAEPVTMRLLAERRRRRLRLTTGA